MVELCLVFLRLGMTAFGGPAAHIAMMRTECVDKRHWLSEAEFLDLMGAANLMPGPSSTEVAILIGKRRAGWLGLLAAGVCFILPASLIVTAIAWFYVRYGHLPRAAEIFYGIKPVIIAIVAHALWTLARTALKSNAYEALTALNFVVCAAGAPPLAVLCLSGSVLGIGRWLLETGPRSLRPIAALAGVVILLICVPAALSLFRANNEAPHLTAILGVFVKLGCVVYGSGYVLLAFLRTDLVTHQHWLTIDQLLDSIAVGQLTPGPVFTTATFIGYLLAGPKGAFVATLGIFLPAFAFVALSGPLVPRIRRSPIAGAFLDGVNTASVALMAFVCLQLARAALIDITTCIIAGASAFVLFKWRVNSVWLVTAGALIGVLANHHSL